MDELSIAMLVVVLIAFVVFIAASIRTNRRAKEQG